MEVRELVGALVTLGGAAFLFLGALGIVRMPDLYNRMQAGTKATTLGNILTLVGLAIYEPAWLPKLLLVVLFVLMTNPVSSHALARAAHRGRVPLSDLSVEGALAEALAEEGAAAARAAEAAGEGRS